MDEDNDDKDDTKRKSRNLSEKKRRDHFNTLVNDLSALITTSNRKMDKSTVLKSTIAFLKHHNEVADRSKIFEIQQDWKPAFLTNDEFTHLMLEALDGFIIVFCSSGSIYYASDSITSLLGYLPSDLHSMTIFDLTYQTDHDNLCSIFQNSTPLTQPMQMDITASNQVSFNVHLKRSGLDKLDDNAYELVKFVGYFRNDTGTSSQSETMPLRSQQTTESEVVDDKKLIFVGTGRLQTPQLMREMSAIDPTNCEFTSKYSMEWKFLMLDHRAPPIIGYMPFEVLGTSGYDYYHFDDLDSILTCHEELMQKGQAKSCYYRFLTKGQQWIWLQSDFCISYHQSNSKPDYVAGTHKVVSYADVIKQNRPADGKSTPSSTLTLRDMVCPQKSNTNSLDANLVKPFSDVEAATPPPQQPLPPLKPAIDVNVFQSKASKTSRFGSNFSNGSTASAVASNVKRKRYLQHVSRGNESDSTSISADSGTSQYSLQTHLSSTGGRCRQSKQSMQQHSHQQRQQRQRQHQQQQTLHQEHQHQQTVTQSHQKIIQMHPKQKLQHSSSTQQQLQHPSSTTQIASSSQGQFPLPSFPVMRNSQIVDPTTVAVPVQPVMSPFSVCPVVTFATPELLPGAVVMTQPQTQIQDQLQRKHDELQNLIMQQQDELRIVSEQLLLARYHLVQPAIPFSYNNVPPSTSRNFNFATNSNLVAEQQFNQFGFAMDTSQMQKLQDHQIMLQQHNQQTNQQQQLQQHHLSTTIGSMHRKYPNAHQDIGPKTVNTTTGLELLQQQHQQQKQQQQQQQQQHQQQQQQQQHQQLQTQQQHNVMSGNVPDLEAFSHEEIDAFLNLTPIQQQSLSEQPTAMSQQQLLPQLQPPSFSHQTFHTLQVPHPSHVQQLQQSTVDQNLMSYMDLSAERSSMVDFPMDINDTGAGSQSEDPTTTSRGYISTNSFHPTQTTQLPNESELLPFQISHQNSQNLFNSLHRSGSSQ